VLRQMRPRAQFNLTVKGGRNMTADAMYSTLVQELAGNHYDLVLWQTGTVEAVRGARPQMLREVLEQGVDAAVKAEADVVLIDPQFSRFLRANTDMNPYEMVLEQIAGMPGVSLFRRFELTQGWVSSGQIDLERVGQDKRDKTIALLNTCLGHALARYVLTGTEAR
jgi:acyl-CoA thioesterase-1